MGEGLNLVHDLYHPELHGHLGLIGFGPEKKKKKGTKQVSYVGDNIWSKNIYPSIMVWCIRRILLIHNKR